MSRQHSYVLHGGRNDFLARSPAVLREGGGDASGASFSSDATENVWVEWISVLWSTSWHKYQGWKPAVFCTAVQGGCSVDALQVATSFCLYLTARRLDEAPANRRYWSSSCQNYKNKNTGDMTSMPPRSAVPSRTFGRLSTIGVKDRVGDEGPLF